MKTTNVRIEEVALGEFLPQKLYPIEKQNTYYTLFGLPSKRSHGARHGVYAWRSFNIGTLFRYWLRSPCIIVSDIISAASWARIYLETICFGGYSGRYWELLSDHPRTIYRIHACLVHHLCALPVTSEFSATHCSHNRIMSIYRYRRRPKGLFPCLISQISAQWKHVRWCGSSLLPNVANGGDLKILMLGSYQSY